MRWVLSKVVVVGGAITNKKEISRKAYEQAIGREFDPCTFSRALKDVRDCVKRLAAAGGEDQVPFVGEEDSPSDIRCEWVNGTQGLLPSLMPELVCWDTLPGVQVEVRKQGGPGYENVTLHVGAAITAAGSLMLFVLPPMNGAGESNYSSKEWMQVLTKLVDQAKPGGALVVGGTMPDGVLQLVNIVDTQRPQKFKPGTKLRFVLLLDGAPQHTSKAALRASMDAGVPQLRMPPYSPDLNPTEQASTTGVLPLLREAASMGKIGFTAAQSEELAAELQRRCVKAGAEARVRQIMAGFPGRLAEVAAAGYAHVPVMPGGRSPRC